MSNATVRVAKCGHSYLAPRADGRAPKVCGCCKTRKRIAEFLTPCRKCGIPIAHEQNFKQGPRRRFHKRCEPSKRRHDPLPERNCARCDARFKPVGERNVYCSAQCQGYQPKVNPEQVCEFTECGKMFRPANTRQRSCSPAHARKAWQERNLERDADIRRNVYHRRRARKKGGVLGEAVIRSEIAERDAWTCHLCAVEIPRDAAWPDPLSLSIDHVIPLSKGGLHDPSNVKASHLRCNVEKGDQVAA